MRYVCCGARWCRCRRRGNNNRGDTHTHTDTHAEIASILLCFCFSRAHTHTHTDGHARKQVGSACSNSAHQHVLLLTRRGCRGRHTPHVQERKRGADAGRIGCCCCRVAGGALIVASSGCRQVLVTKPCSQGACPRAPAAAVVVDVQAAWCRLGRRRRLLPGRARERMVVQPAKTDRPHNADASYASHARVDTYERGRYQSSPGASCLAATTTNREVKRG